MCGIVGKLVFDNITVVKDELKIMSDAISHRGPDGEGFWIEENKKIGFGHRRLAIIDLTEKGNQPMHVEHLSIAFNGEIYNYLEVRANLKEKGYVFRTETDTEVILVSYLEYGEGCLQLFDGMFAFAIWDNNKKELFIARDRFGEKPFYYYKDENQFVFASEMKALFAIGISKEVDLNMMFLYLTYDVVENPHDKSQTFYKLIKQLPASTFLKINGRGQVKIQKYWDIDLKNKSNISFEEGITELQSLLEKSITYRMRSDVRVGASLSGGVDSSSLLACIRKLYPKDPFNTFTARFDDMTFDEGEHLLSLKNQYQFNSYECFPNSNGITEDLDKIFWHQEEPFGSTSIIAQWEVMKLAKYNNTTVLLDGQGADEVFGGYFSHFLPYLYDVKRNNRSMFNHELRKIEKHLGVNQYLSRQEKIRMRSPYLYDKLADFTRPYRISNVGLDLNKEFKNSFANAPSPFHRSLDLNTYLYNDVYKYGLGKLLRFSDRNAMAHSVEVRLPYLSHQLVEFVFSLPCEYKINAGWTKYILRKSMEDRVPKSILYRTDKKGFQAPDSWMNEKSVKSLINESVSKLQKDGIISQPNQINNWKYLMASKTLYDNKC